MNAIKDKSKLDIIYRVIVSIAAQNKQQIGHKTPKGIHIELRKYCPLERSN